MNNMEIQKSVYVPVLKWRMGEYQALDRLDQAVKEGIVPLIVIPPIEYDFEEQRMKKTLQAHIEPFTKKFCTKWGRKHALIDIHNSLEQGKMNSGDSVITHVFKCLKDEGCNAVPVASLSKVSVYQTDIKKIIQRDQKGAVVRITFEELMNPSLNDSIEKLMALLYVTESQIDLIIDLGKPQLFEPYSELSRALLHRISSIKHIDAFRSFVIIGTSLQLSNIKKPGGEVQRHEWHLYKNLVEMLPGSYRIPSFGDYTIETPGFISLDMRFIKSGGKIIYSTDDSWYIVKGKAFRGNESQMIGHCKSIINSGYYLGNEYSHGDKRIEDTATGKQNHGNLSTWKQVGVSHHLSLVVAQLSNFHEA